MNETPDASGRRRPALPDGHSHGERMGLGQRLFYRFMLGVVWSVASTFFRVRIHGKGDRMPLSGPYIVAPNHRSNLDTPLVAVLTSRRLRYMGKDSLWTSKFGAWFLTSLGGFPVERGSADRAALRACQEVLARGEPLVLFPEGTRGHGDVLGDYHDGAAYLACKMGVPIVPVGLAGTEQAMPTGSRTVRPAKLVVVVGEPINPPVPAGGGRVSRREIRELTAELRGTTQRLFDEARRRA